MLLGAASNCREGKATRREGGRPPARQGHGRQAMKRRPPPPAPLPPPPPAASSQRSGCNGLPRGSPRICPAPQDEVVRVDRCTRPWPDRGGRRGRALGRRHAASLLRRAAVRDAEIPSAPRGRATTEGLCVITRPRRWAPRPQGSRRAAAPRAGRGDRARPGAQPVQRRRRPPERRVLRPHRRDPRRARAAPRAGARRRPRRGGRGRAPGPVAHHRSSLWDARQPPAGAGGARDRRATAHRGRARSASPRLRARLGACWCSWPRACEGMMAAGAGAATRSASARIPVGTSGRGRVAWSNRRRRGGRAHRGGLRAAAEQAADLLSTWRSMRPLTSPAAARWPIG